MAVAVGVRHHEAGAVGARHHEAGAVGARHGLTPRSLTAYLRVAFQGTAPLGVVIVPSMVLPFARPL